MNWISVDNKLPELIEFNYFPIGHKDDKETTDWIIDEGFFWDGEHWVFKNNTSLVVLVLLELDSKDQAEKEGSDRYAFAVYSDTGWYSAEGRESIIVTHWMPLPEPPGQEVAA